MEGKIDLAKLAEVQKWLESVRNPCYDCEPCGIVINGQLYGAVRYSQDLISPSELPYTVNAWYVLGDLPKGWNGGSMTKDGTEFVADDGSRYFVAGYADCYAITTHPEAHPFGLWFGIHFKSGNSLLNPSNEMPIEISYL